jgi:lambda repressor-like predicted transcriptional regulator
MSRKNQDLFSYRVKVALLGRGLTVGALAKQVGRTRETVSRAIHRGRFPAVQQLIKEALSL